MVKTNNFMPSFQQNLMHFPRHFCNNHEISFSLLEKFLKTCLYGCLRHPKLASAGEARGRGKVKKDQTDVLTDRQPFLVQPLTIKLNLMLCLSGVRG